MKSWKISGFLSDAFINSYLVFILMRIREIPVECRPRERMELYGPDVLSSAELLAVILQKGTRKENAVEMCQRLLSLYPLEQLSSLSTAQLCQVHGIGQVKALQIAACFALARRCRRKQGIMLNNVQEVFAYASPVLEGKDKEHLLVLLLDAKKQVIKEEIVSIGTLDSSLLHPREIFKLAIQYSAHSIILVHNHPSGDSQPSNEDIQVTQQLVEAGRLLGIPVLDHVVIGNGSSTSILSEKSSLL